MLYFESDYTEGACPEIIKRFAETNMESLVSYGNDKYSESAKEKIKSVCKCPEGQIYFLTGGTQTNSVVIASMLKSYEGVVCAATGHIGAHEAGAIEYTGHKVLPIKENCGKIEADELDKFISDFYADGNHEHMVFPGMAYISYPTEYGTIYSKAELSAIYDVCKKHKIPLYIDGARLGYGLMSSESDMDIADIARLCDVFYIGGTKVGALCGEAVVFTHGNAPEYFMTIVKQHGAMIAKGRVLGIQFDTLFTDNLYFNVSRHAVEMAEKLKKLLISKGYKMFINSPTNQQFVILQNEKMNKLSAKVKFSYWEKYDENHTVVRFATSWATTEESIEKLGEIL